MGDGLRRLWLMGVERTSTVNNQRLFSASRRLWLRDVGRTSTLNNQPSTVFFNNQQSTINNQLLFSASRRILCIEISTKFLFQQEGML
jgi:hypothetical protein